MNPEKASGKFSQFCPNPTSIPAIQPTIPARAATPGLQPFQRKMKTSTKLTKRSRVLALPSSFC